MECNFAYGADHPANYGIDYKFLNMISEDTLNNYLSRAMIDSCFDYLDDMDFVYDNLRMILNTGTKYVARAYTTWLPDAKQIETYPVIKQCIDEVHEKDPDVIFEGCIFETAWHGMDTINIPEWVFEAFDMPAENRSFNYQEMIFQDGTMKDEFGPGISCPDVRRLETKLYMYFRAKMLIDIGFEALHMGQTWRIGMYDEGYREYEDLLTRIRMYAHQKARRNLVLMNGHNPIKPLMTDDKKHLLDFVCSPACLFDEQNGKQHLPSELNPQKAYIKKGFGPYGVPYPGISVNGEYTETMPYLVEFDNWMQAPGDLMAQISNATDKICVPWGYDEISWYVNQPEWYRIKFLRYMFETVQSFDKNGHFEMPGLRTGFHISTGQVQPHCASATTGKFNWGEEPMIRQIWIDNKSE